MNDNDHIAGTLQLQDGGSRTFLATSTSLVVGNTLGGFHSNAHAVNNRGEVVGGSWSIPGNTPGDKRERAFKWVPGEDLQDIGALGEDWCSRSVGINDRGTVVGLSHPRGFAAIPNRAFIFKTSVGLVDLGSLDGGSASPVAINNLDQVVGLATFRSRSVSFIWEPEVGMRALPLPNRSSVRAINDRGVIVYTRETSQGARAFLWENGVEVALPCFRGHQSEAASINNAGEIIGHIWRGNHGHAVKWGRVV